MNSIVLKDECPLCGTNCPGGAHRNALIEAGILTREQYLKLCSKERRNLQNAQAIASKAFRDASHGTDHKGDALYPYSGQR